MYSVKTDAACVLSMRAPEQAVPASGHSGDVRQSAVQRQEFGEPGLPQVQEDGMHSVAEFRQERDAGFSPGQLVVPASGVEHTES
jgi:hypothetical protein